jgi:transposase
MIPLALLPISDLVDLQSLEREEGRFLLALKTKCTHDFCPDCGEKSTNRHSTYMRKLMDLPWAGIPVRVNLQVYKYYCKNENCHRKIFAQRMGEKIKPYARRTHRLTEHLNQIGFALGGNAGSKLAAFLGMPVSSSTLIRVILKSDDHPVSIPRVMGVDDWAFRKGQTYGTILVDLEKRKPIDCCQIEKLQL